MSTITLEEAQATLPDIIDRLTAGDGIVITKNHVPVARILGLAGDVNRPVPGSCQGMLTVLADDDDHLQDWKEYLP